MIEYQSMDASLGRHALELAQQEWGKQQPLNQAFAELVSDPNRQCNTLGNWYVVSIEHQQGQLARAEIASRGMVAYLPILPHRERHGRGAARTVWRPMFGLYMFVRCMPAQWGLVTAARGIRRFLGRNGRPEPIEDGQIEVIRLVESEQGEAGIKRAATIWHFTEGDAVRIKEGAFSGFYATLAGSVDSHDRIRALVTYFGRQSLVELSAFEIEKAI